MSEPTDWPINDPPPVVDESKPWRRRLARWPDPWRERWGVRANALEDTGLDWRQAEQQAFEELKTQKEQD